MKKTVFITPRHLALAEKLVKDGFYLNFDDIMAAGFRLLAKEHPGFDQNPLPIKIETESSDDVIFLGTKQTTQLPESSNPPPTIVELPKAVAPPPSIFFEPGFTGEVDPSIPPHSLFFSLESPLLQAISEYKEELSKLQKIPSDSLIPQAAQVKKRKSTDASSLLHSAKKKKSTKKSIPDQQQAMLVEIKSVPENCINIALLARAKLKEINDNKNTVFWKLATTTLKTKLKKHKTFWKNNTAICLFLSIIDFQNSIASYTKENFKKQLTDYIILKLKSIKTIQQWHELIAWRSMQILMIVSKLALSYYSSPYLRDYNYILEFINQRKWHIVFFPDRQQLPEYRVATPNYALKIDKTVKPPVVTVKYILADLPPLQTISEHKNEPSEPFNPLPAIAENPEAIIDRGTEGCYQQQPPSILSDSSSVDQLPSMDMPPPVTSSIPTSNALNQFRLLPPKNLDAKPAGAGNPSFVK